MFADMKSLLARLGRLPSLLRAFALLEDAPASDAPERIGSIREHSSARPDVYRAASVCERGGGSDPTATAGTATHPHRHAVDRAWLTRRAGATAPRPAACLTPVRRTVARPLRQPAP